MTPQQERRKELQARLNDIRKEQGANKAGRTSTMDQIKRLDEQLKSRINEQKVARGKVNYKTVEDVDREIASLEKQVDGGQMKLVDEKKALAEVSSLRKLRKSFGGFEEEQKKIDEIKLQIRTLKDSMNDPVAKARSEEYNKIQAELDVIKAEQDEAYKNVSTLRDEKTALQKQQQAKYQEIRAAKDAHWAQKRAFQNYEFEARSKLRERKKAEQDAYNNQKKRERAEKVLAEASEPAYLDEIRRASSLLHYFEPSSAADSKPLLAPSGLAASSGRTVDDAGIKGFKLVKKDEEDYFAGTGGKKGKKGKKGTSSPAVASGKFTVPPSVLEDCSAMSIDPPMSQAEVPAVIEKVKAKLDHWKTDQKVQTEKVSKPHQSTHITDTNPRDRTSPRHRRRLSALMPRSLAPPPQRRPLPRPLNPPSRVSLPPSRQ